MAGFKDVADSKDSFADLKEKVMTTLRQTAEKGFDKAMVNCVLNIIEMNSREHKVNFGIQLSESLIGFFNYRNVAGVSSFLEISGGDEANNRKHARAPNPNRTRGLAGKINPQVFPGKSGGSRTDPFTG